jgi:hypothetical protein
MLELSIVSIYISTLKPSLRADLLLKSVYFLNLQHQEPYSGTT